MSPRFYGYLWMVFALSGGVLWIASMATMLVGVVFGFIAFGLVFAGMICVLPGTVSHPAKVKIRKPTVELDPAMRPVEFRSEPTDFRLSLRVH